MADASGAPLSSFKPNKPNKDVSDEAKTQAGRTCHVWQDIVNKSEVKAKAESDLVKAKLRFRSGAERAALRRDEA